MRGACGEGGVNVGSLFSGVGGFDLGLERAGFRIAWHSEIEAYACAVLRKHWPDVPNHGDIRGITAATVEPVDVLCGGWPCQTSSTAARGRNNHPDMWPEYLRVIAELRPAWVVAENVPRALHGWDRIASDLEREGYAAASVDCDVALPERQRGRHRAFIVAHADSNSEPRLCLDEEVARVCAAAERVRHPEPRVVGVADGVPSRMDRMRCLGNAFPPYLAEAIGRAIMRVERA